MTVGNPKGIVVILVVIVGVTLRRRQELGRWLQPKLRYIFAASTNNTSVVPDGPVVTTLVGCLEIETSLGATEIDASHQKFSTIVDESWMMQFLCLQQQ